MKKIKRAKAVKKGPSLADLEQIAKIYTIPSYHVHGAYFTPRVMDKSTSVRITFSEFDAARMVNVPNMSVTMNLEDLQNIYNAMTELLQQMRKMGRIA